MESQLREKADALARNLAALRSAGRSTQGVRLVRLEEGDRIAAACLIPAEANGNGEEKLPLIQ